MTSPSSTAMHLVLTLVTLLVPVPGGAGMLGGVDGLRAEWIRMPPSVPRIEPRRSGHASFNLERGALRHYIFGGYAEYSADPREPRHVVNDLWHWEEDAGGWHRVDGCTGDLPPARLVAAAAALPSAAYLVGGWDPGVPGTGGTILDTCYKLDLKTHEWTRLPDFPEGPTSRHVAATVRDPGVESGERRLLLVHTHRCLDRVWRLDADSGTFFAQPTTGTAPSARGLHAACGAGSRLVVFGGAAKDGTMSNLAFVLDAKDWKWTELEMTTSSSKGLPAPSPRAAPCLVPYNDDVVVLFGGAEATPNGLKPRGDVWALDLRRQAWKLLIDDEDEGDESYNEKEERGKPPPRNAATLACIRDEDGTSRDYLLTGGWHPFVRTWDDCFVLRVRDDERQVLDWKLAMDG